MTTKGSAVIVGNSDGIGLALTRRLLDLGWSVHGLSRSPSPIRHDAYVHAVADVATDDYRNELERAGRSDPDVCVYCAGIGEDLDLNVSSRETNIFEVNLIGAVKTLELIVPGMIARRRGHCLILSSIADNLNLAEAPSYSASKAGLTSYVESLALAVRDKGVTVTNVRFGFVDTKMAKGDHKPFMMTPEKAVDYLMQCLRKRPIRFTRPRIMGLLVSLARIPSRLKVRFGSGG